MQGYPLVIQISVFFITANSIMGIAIYTNLTLVRRKKQFRENQIRKVQGKIKEFFLELLENDLEFTEQDIFEQFEFKIGKVTKRSIRSIVGALEDIIRTDRKYRESVNFERIIKAFDVVGQLEAKLDFSDTRTRLSIFQTLSTLELTISDSKILPHTFSKDRAMRQESRSSYMGVSKNDPFKFFEQESDNRLNDWDQMVLLQQFSIHHKDSLPDFSRWIKYSKERTQIIFFTKMIDHFNQRTSANTLVELLSHEDHKIRKEAILALGRMRYTAVEPKLMEIYNFQPVICQDAIIEAIAYFQTGRAFTFLKDVYGLSANSNSKKLISEVLYLYGAKGRAFFEEKLKSEKGFNKLILLHVQNPLIKSDLRERIKKLDDKEKSRIDSGELSSDHNLEGLINGLV